MALTRKLLSGMGLNEEQIDTIIEAHTDTVDGLKADVIKYKGDAEKLPGIQAEFDAYKKDVAAKEAHAAKEKAFRAILKDANLSEKGIEKAIKYAEWDKIEIEADGKLKGASAHVKAAKEEWSEYVTTTTTTGANTSTPPANNGSAKMTRAEIYKKDDKGRYVMSTSERQKALAENPDLMN